MATPDNQDYIFIRDLVIEMSAGIYEYEKLVKQPVIINIELEVKSNKGESRSSINDVVSYEDIVNEITQISQSKHYELLEEFAENIACMCLGNDKVMKVKISAEKPDIIDNTKSVGVKIIRS